MNAIECYFYYNDEQIFNMKIINTKYIKVGYKVELFNKTYKTYVIKEVVFGIPKDENDEEYLIVYVEQI